MNEKDLIPEDSGYYRTGDTEPTPKRNGLVTVLLVAVIVLGGLVSVMGIMNLQLFGTSDVPSAVSNTPLVFTNDPMPTMAPASEDAQHNFAVELETTPQSVENIPQEGGLSLQAIYEKALPSVVSILCDTPAGTSTGTGVILSADGYIVTNHHVVENARSVQVLFQDNSTLTAMLVGTDKVSDLAVLYVERSELPAAEFGNSDALRVGDAVVAIGDPLGTALRGTMTDGIISAINRDISSQGRTMTLIQTNAALNSGNSGGPLLNCYGQVVGINTLKIGDNMDTAGVEGLGFAIPSTTVKEVADQLINQGFVSGRPSLGLSGETVSSFLQHYYRLPQGVYVTAVNPGGAAQKAGIAVGDIILFFNGNRIAQSEDLTTALYACTAGDQVEIIIYRAGLQYSATVTIDQAN